MPIVYAPDTLDLTAPPTNIGTVTPPAITVSTLFRSANTGNVPFIANPSGTGGFQLQVATNTIVGGNLRAPAAIDLQLSRNAATQVASGYAAFVQGANCTASGIYSFARGVLNIASGDASSAQGASCTASGIYSFAYGQSNTALNSYSIALGNNCAASGYAAFVGGETCTASGTYSFTYGNLCTASGASSFAQGQNSIASGNRSFASGQNNTASSLYSMALGFSNTSSSQASVAIGTSNTSSGFNSLAIGDGNNATMTGSIALGNLNNSTNYYSFAVGTSNTASNSNSIAIGASNISSNCNSFAVGGLNNSSGYSSIAAGYGNISSSESSCAIGQNNTANGAHSFATGSYANTKGIRSLFAIGAGRIIHPVTFSSGLNQSTIFSVGDITTNNTPKVMQQIILGLFNNSALAFTGLIVASVDGGGDCKSWKFEGMIQRGANAASTALVAAITPTIIVQKPNASTWNVGFSADTFLGSLMITVTGETGKTIRWNCTIYTSEVAF